MFETERKVAKMAELLQKGKEDAERRSASLREQNMEDVPTSSGNVAAKVKVFATGQAKRPPSALDGAACLPPPKRVSVMKAPPVEKPPPAKKKGFPEETLAKMIPKAKFVGEERGKDPAMKKPPGLPPPAQLVRPPIPKQLPDDPPAPPPGAPTGPQRQIPEPPTWDPPEDEIGVPIAPAAGPMYVEANRFAKDPAPVPAGPPPKAVQTVTGPVCFATRKVQRRAIRRMCRRRQRHSTM